MLSRLLLAFVLLLLAESAAAKPPNIILILADDLGYGHLGSYGQQKIKTPHLDQLAAEGLRFTQAYAGSTVCAPSRTSLLTGLHTGHTPIRGNRDMILPSHSVTIAEVLQRAGYTTAVIGKWGLGKANLEWSFPTRQGFDQFYGYLDHVSAHDHYPHELWRGERRVKVSGYSSDLFTSAALHFIERHRIGPFFLYLAYTLPHPAIDVPEEAMSGYEFPEQPYEDYHYGKQERPRAAFAGMVTRLDEGVGAIVAKLKRLGVARNTLILFTSDNGPGGDYLTDAAFFDASGGLRDNKESLYEGGIRVPLIAWWPHTIEAGRQDYATGQWDFMPTFAELGGVTVQNTDGISLVPLLHGASQRDHKYLYWEAHGALTAQAVRFGEWKALRTAPNLPIELYDLRTDPGETNDLARARPDLVEKAETFMADAHQENPRWLLHERTLWTDVLEIKERVGRWARAGQAHDRWWGVLADAWDAMH